MVIEEKTREMSMKARNSRSGAQNEKPGIGVLPLIKRLPSLRLDWIWMIAALMLVCFILTSTHLLYRTDLLFFDVASPIMHRVSANKIVVIAVDDRTVASLGGWPLSEGIHAKLIDRLTASKVAAVGFDLTTAHPVQATAADSEALANAMGRNGRVVTKLLLHHRSGTDSDERSGPVSVATAAYASGHTDVQRDDDGVVRGVRMFAGGGARGSRHMSTLVLEAGGFTTSAYSAEASCVAAVSRDGCARYVPLGRTRSFDTYSYVDVLRGRVPESHLEGRIVLVGATAEGIASRLATPTADGSALTDVEFLAEAINASITSTLVRPAGYWCDMIFSEGVVPLTCLLLYLLSPRASLIASVCLAGAIAGGTVAMLKFEHVFLSPCAGILTCAVAYPLWAWRRQEALLSYLSMEAARVATEPSLPEEPRSVKIFTDPIARQLNATASLFDQVRRHREFVSGWVDSLPEATLLTTSAGEVILANARVLALGQTSGLPRTERSSPVGRPVSDVLFEITASHRAIEFTSQALSTFAHSSGDQDSPAHSESKSAQGIEISNARGGRSLLIKCAQIKPSVGRDGALIFHVADVSSVRKAERQRDAVLRFLSHDMRSPQAAILAMVEQMKQDPPRFTFKEFSTLVGQYATTALSLADDFLFLARAESLPPKLTQVDPALVLGDAIDDLWPQATARSTTVNLIAEPGKSTIADVRLLRRAFANLISNAIKFSPQYATVDVQLAETDRHLKISVIDSGVGIPEHERRAIFLEFTQLDEKFSRSGHGLGLAFVKTVVDSLGGKLQVDSVLGQGTTFIVFLPKINGDALRQPVT
jgi:signal transduction histidine kinase/CHASE2 domain-containing sensor protein